MTEYDRRQEKRPAKGRRTNIIAIGVAVVAVAVAVAAWVVPRDETQPSSGPAPVTTTADPAPADPAPADPAPGETEPVDPSSSEPRLESSASETPPADEAPAGDTEPRRTGSITLNQNYAVQLDTDTPNWNVHRGCDQCNLHFDEGFANLHQGGVVRLAPSDPDVLATCAAATAYTERIMRREMKPGLRFCVRMRGGMALVKITKTVNFGDDAVGDDSVTFTVKAWF